MTDYVSSIGLPGQTGYDYTDLYDWMGDAEAFSGYNPGDRLIAVLSNVAPDSGDKYHRLRLQSASLSQWATTNHVEVIVSGTNTDRSTPFSVPWVYHRDIVSVMTDTGEKTFKFVNLDLYSDSRFRINSNQLRGMTESVSSCTVIFSGCRIVNDNNIAFIEDFMGDCSAVSAASPSPLTHLQFYNCSIDARKRNFSRAHGTIYGVRFMQVDVVGCSIRSQATGNNYTFAANNDNNTTGYWQFNISGSNFDNSGTGRPIARYDDSLSWHYQGNAIDYITAESTADVQVYASSLTNVSSAASFQYGGSLPADTVGFSGDYTTTAFTGDTADHRLNQDSDNIAFNYVTNVTLPSPDLLGTDRGVAPFDAGAFELSVQSAPDESGPAGGVALPLTFAYRININD